MKSQHKTITLASRASKLAQTQARIVIDLLAPLPAEILTLSTKGDEVLDRSLAEIGGKGLFVKALEAALLEGKADAAVHSAKDMESEIASGTYIAAFLEREDRRDALIGAYSTLEAIPQGGVIGTASIRRSAMVRALRPDLEIKLLRGNVTSRLEALNEGKYDAIILAMAGLNRLGISENVHPIAEEKMLPAVGQGALAIQGREDGDSDINRALEALNHEKTAIEVIAERALLAKLDGDCTTPIGATAKFTSPSTLEMKAALYSHDGKIALFSEGVSHPDDNEKLGRQLAEDLLKQAKASNLALGKTGKPLE